MAVLAWGTLRRTYTFLWGVVALAQGAPGGGIHMSHIHQGFMVHALHTLYITFLSESADRPWTDRSRLMFWNPQSV